MDCKGCIYEGCDTLFCNTAKLGEAWNDFLKATLILRPFSKKEYHCKHKMEVMDETKEK